MNSNKHSKSIWPSCLLALVIIGIGKTHAHGVAIDLSLSDPVGSAAQFGTSAANLLSDPFAYDPNLPYFETAALPAGTVPDTAFSPPASFVSGSATTDRFWQADVTLGGATLDWVDIWGRTNAGSGEDGRHQNLTLSFYSGSGASGALLGTSGLFDPTGQVAGVAGSAYGRFDVSTILNASQRSQVGSFRIDQSAAPAPDQFLLLQEVRAASGVPESPIPLMFVNRDTGDVSIVNGATSTNIIGYSITSASGALNAAAWDSFSSGANNGSLDPDSWTTLSASVDGGRNLSEAESPGGSGGYELAPGASLDLGPIWTRVATEDLQLLLLNADGSSTTPAVAYTGNGGASFLSGDLDFNGSINLADWALFRAGFGGRFDNLTGGQTYVQGDLDADLDVDVDDFRAFEAAFDAANPGTSLAAAIASIPEPGAFAITCLALLFGLLSRNRSHRLGVAFGLAVVCLNGAAAPNAASAQTFTIIPAPADPENDVSASSVFPPSAGDFRAFKMFDSTVTEADIDVRNLGGVDGEFAAQGQGPVSVFVDNNSSITTNWIAFAQRSAEVDLIGEIEVWFSDTDFGGELPTTSPDAVADIADRTNPDIFKSFQLSSTVSGRYAAMRFNRAPESFIGIGGREFRFLQGPEQFTLEVNTGTGEMSIRNNGALAQALNIDAYEIASEGGSLTSTGFTGLAGTPGFPSASPINSGNGWELGGGSGDNLLAEAYLLGGSSVALESDLSIGTGYNTAIDSRDLTFSFSLENGAKLLGNVEYIVPAGVTGDYNNDGVVDAADYTLWRANVGSDSSVLANNSIPGTVGEPHFIQWRSQYGSTAASTSISSIPEPSAFGLSALGLALFSAGVRRKRRPFTSVLATSSDEQEIIMTSNGFLRNVATLCLVVMLASTSLSSASTPDRLYLLGDDSNEPTSGPVNELGASNLGMVIGSQSGTSFDGFSLDHAGDSSNFDTFADLAPMGDPRYIDVGQAGLQRPGATGVSVGADLDGNDYLFTTSGFGNPSNADDAYQNTIDYTGLINHYMQGWARPTSAGVPGQRQTLIRDTDQFRMHIDTDSSGQAYWGQHYSLSSQTTSLPVELNEWAHVAQYSNGDRSILWVDGVIAGVLDGYFNPNGFGVEGTNQGATALSLGSDVTGINSTPSNFFTGQLDDFDVRVTGDNSNLPAGANYGAFDLEEDNAFVASMVESGQLVPGDVNGDLVVNGDGTGDPSSDDVSFFIDHYLDQQVINFQVVGDLNSRMTMADLNYSGTTNLFDWLILINNHENAALAQTLVLGALLQARTVPEPASMASCMLLMLLLGAVGRKRSSRGC